MLTVTAVTAIVVKKTSLKHSTHAYTHPQTYTNTHMLYTLNRRVMVTLQLDFEVKLENNMYV